MASDSRLMDYSAEKKVFTKNPYEECKSFIFQNQCGVSYSGWSDFEGHYLSYWLQKFNKEKVTPQTSITDTAEMLKEYFNALSNDKDIVFHIAGYEKFSDISIQKVIRVITGPKTEIAAISTTVPFTPYFIYDGFRPPINALLGGNYLKYDIHDLRFNCGLQNPITLAWELEQYTIKELEKINFEVVGEPIDILAITPSVSRWIQHKKVNCL